MSKVFLKGILEFVKLCGVAVFVLGFTALVGHLFGLAGLYTWFSRPMAFNTSVALIFAGLGLFASGMRLDGRNEHKGGGG